MGKRGTLFIVSAPSGAGKTTLVNALINKVGHIYDVCRLVTYTSRAPRAGEVPGRDYYYVDRADFEQKRAEGFFLEWVEALGHYYGTGRQSTEEHLALGRSAIMILDQEGARRVNEQVNSVLIWITVPSIDVLARRLLGRGTENDAQVEQRLKRAAQEMAQEKNKKTYHYHVQNDDFTQAVDMLQQIVEQELQQKNKKV
jgi:guanylate kinase